MADFLWTFAVEEMLKKVLKVAGEQTGLAWGFQEHLSNLQKWLLMAEALLHDFDKTVWVCVSEPFIVNKILLDILEHVKGAISNGGNSKEVLLRELQKEMLGQRYFLVLYDVWNEDSFLWNELKYCLLNISENSKNSIVVTTSAEVAKIMGTCPNHLLGKLSDDQCWSLFKESANAYGLSMTSNLGIIQKELVKKIGGVPLVAQVLGRTLKFEGDVERWKEMFEKCVKNSTTRGQFCFVYIKIKCGSSTIICIKAMFSYCSIFPKDFVFEKQGLVKMWMAQGFLQPQEGRNVTMENVGDIYFKILLSHCLFQVANEIKMGEYYEMHDLVHDIAIAISRDQNLQLNPSNILEKELQKKEIQNVACKLLTIDFIQKIPHNIDQTLFDYVKIRNFVSLRILKISSDKLPKSIGQLKHLRYLEILSNSMRLKFPDSIVSLHNLQTLKFLHSKIEEFPMNFTNLANLRHLELWVSSDKTPLHLSRLTQLQTLSHFAVGFEKGFKITELGPLKNLQGSLSLSCLEKVKSKEEANGANLAEKENLKELHLNWDMERKDNNSYNDLEVLEGLQPNQNLQLLIIHSFAERRLPNKIFVENLKVIHLYSSFNCLKLPMLGQLNNLKELEIYSFLGVQIIDNEFYGNDPNKRRFFPKLEKFVMCEMINLEQWEEVMANDATSNITSFPNLKCLEISRCPKLLNIPEVFYESGMQHFQSLSVSHCNKLTKLPNGLHFCSSIRHVRIDQCSNLSIDMRNKPKLCYLNIGPLEKLPEDLCHLMNLREMEIVGNMQNYDFGILQHLPSLKQITLVEDELSNNSVTQIPQQLQHLTALEFLSIKNFGGIEALPEWLGNFVCLQTLSLSNCKNLKKLPSTEAILCLTKLKKMYVYKCPQLLLDEGEMKRAKLSDLPDIQIYFNSYAYSTLDLVF